MTMYDMPIIFKLLAWFNKHPNCNLYEASLDLKITYSYISKIKDFAISNGWITGERSGRVLEINLTEKGKEIVMAYELLESKLGMIRNDKDISNEKI